MITSCDCQSIGRSLVHRSARAVVRTGSPTRYGPAMTTTEELLQREDAAWSAFVDAFGAVPEDRRSDEGVVPGWSMHDLVWHCGFWAGYVAEVLHKIARGEPTEDSQDWDAFNAIVVEDGRAMSWDEVIVRSEQNRVRVPRGARGVAHPHRRSGRRVHGRDVRALRGARRRDPRVQRRLNVS